MIDTSRVVAGLDIGSSKAQAIIAEVVPEQPLKIVGVGTQPCDGLRRGVVVDLDRTAQAIGGALADAELMAGVRPDVVVAGLSGEHVKSFNSRGVIAVSKRGGEIGEEDIERVTAAAQAVPMPPDREIVHVLPLEYLIDGQGGFKQPVGMAGSRLEIEVHIVTAAAIGVQNLKACVRRTGYDDVRIVLASLASAEALLTEREKEMGVALVDVGAGVTDIAVYFDGAVRYTSTLALGGANVTNDLAIGLRTPVDAAEAIKVSSGVALPELADEGETVMVPHVGDRPARELPRARLATIVEPRLEELFVLAQQEMKKTPYAELMAAGVVIAGGGAVIPGTAELAERVFDLPVRLGKPDSVFGIGALAAQPASATGIGLARHAATLAPGSIVVSREGFFTRAAQRIGHFVAQFI